MLVRERFHYIGPNRRCTRTVIEWLLELEPGEAGSLQDARSEDFAGLTALLRKAGVPEECITVELTPEEGARTALRLARPGDLVILSPGHGEFVAMWDRILAFRSELPAADPAASEP